MTRAQKDSIFETGKNRNKRKDRLANRKKDKPNYRKGDSYSSYSGKSKNHWKGGDAFEY